MKGHYDIAFVGLGSIGKRHLRNVVTLLTERGVTYSIDLYRRAVGDLPLDVIFQGDVAGRVSTQHIEQCVYAEEIAEGRMYDVVFVTNPTSMHYETVRKFAGHTRAFFIEKPVFDSDGVDESIFDELRGTVCYVACPLRYNAVLQYVKENIDLRRVYSARAISSSYLPDWRPGQDYRKTYSAHKDMGGGVAIDLIHEWDYLTWLFGAPEKVFTIQTKVSDLEIDSDDVALYIAKTKGMLIEVHLDYFGRKPMRVLQLFMEGETVECDILNGKIHYLKSGERIDLDSDRNGFQMREIVHFFDIIEGKTENDSSAEHGYAVLKLAKGEI